MSNIVVIKKKYVGELNYAIIIMVRGDIARLTLIKNSN